MRRANRDQSVWVWGAAPAGIATGIYMPRRAETVPPAWRHCHPSECVAGGLRPTRGKSRC